MLTKTFTLVMNHPVPAIELSFFGVYLTLAVSAIRRREWVHAAAYGLAAVLVLGLACCIGLGLH